MKFLRTLMVAVVAMLATVRTPAQRCPGSCSQTFSGLGGTTICGTVVVIDNGNRAGSCTPPPGCLPDRNCTFDFQVIVVTAAGCCLNYKLTICEVDTKGAVKGPCATTPTACVGSNVQDFVGYPVRCGRQESFEYRDPVTGVRTGFAVLTCVACEDDT